MAEQIHFFNEDTKFRLRHKKVLRVWISKIVAGEGKVAGNINLIFCTDSYLLKINKRYLNRNTLTDVIAFSTGEDFGLVEGDIFISVDRIRENAVLYQQRLLQELCRVMAHGVLHLSGWKDDSKVQKDLMHKREDFFVNQLPERIF